MATFTVLKKTGRRIMKPVASIIFGIAMLLVSGNQPLAQEWHRGDGPYRGLQCPAGEHLVPIRNGVKCQKIPVCGPDQTITPGPKGVECKEVEHIESVHVERPLYAFFPARAGNDLDGICMAWLPKYRYRSHMKDDLLPPYAHVDNRGFVATWSYDLDVQEDHHHGPSAVGGARCAGAKTLGRARQAGHPASALR